MNGPATGLMNQAEWAALGYLANAVWQVPLIFGAAWVTARLLRRTGAAAEHRLWVLALLLEAAVPSCSLNLAGVLGWMLGLISNGSSAGDGAVQVALGSGNATALSGLRLPPVVIGGAALLFSLWLVYSAARLGWGVFQTERMRRRAAPVALEGQAALAWLRCGRKLPGALLRAAEVHESAMLSGPVTMGILRPAVLVPIGFLDSVSGDDFEAVIAHELAHVRRWDFAKNLLYETISVGVAWHPAVWITRARVAESREMVCDAMAAEAVAGNESYARSLLRLASMVASGAPAKTLHAIGIFDANSFERRVMNLTKRKIEVRMVQRIGIAAVCAVVALATCATALALRVEIGPQVHAVAAGESAAMKVEPGQLKSTNKTPPVYPAEAKAKKDTIDGSVLLAVVIGKDGSVQNIQIKKSLRADYDRSALDAVKTWQWEPFLLNGEPTEVETTVQVTYSLAK